MSRSKIALPPLRPTSLNRHGKDGDEEEIDLADLRQRFNRQLPKYGFLWRSMAHAKMGQDSEEGEEDGAEKEAAVELSGEDSKGAARRLAAGDKENVSSNNAVKEAPNLLNAILNKQPVSLRVPVDHDVCGEGCDCAEPIVEIIDNEDASVYSNEELVDTDDEAGSGATDKKKSKAVKKVESNPGGGELGEDVDFNASARVDSSLDIDSDEESVVVVSKTPRKKAFVLSDEDDSDDEAVESIGEKSGEGDAEPEGETLGAESDRSIESVEDDSFVAEDADADLEVPRALDFDAYDLAAKSKESGRPTTVRKPTAKAQYVDIMDDSSRASSSSEEEWVELSSDEEEEQPAPRVNTVVILSDDDEEESESENDDAHIAFTISDDSNGDESEDSIFGKPRDRRPPPRKAPSSKPATKRKPPTARRTKPTKSHATPKENKQPNSNAGADPRSTVAFRKNREALTSHTFAEFNRKAFQGALSSVKVSWSNKLNTTAGITRMRGRLGEEHAHTRVAAIELATKVIDDEERLRSTLLHEMCHAAQWLVDGTHKPSHGKVFKKWAAISMRKIRDVEVTTTHDYQIVYRFAWACTAKNCNVVIKRHSRSVDPTKHCCGRCQGKLMEIEVPGSKGDTAKTGYTAKKERKASEFALFVKSQSKSVKNSLARKRSCTPKEVSQADVMKECGRLWRDRKASSNGGAEDALDSMADKLVEMTLNGGSPE